MGSQQSLPDILSIAVPIAAIVFGMCISLKDDGRCIKDRRQCMESYIEAMSNTGIDIKEEGRSIDRANRRYWENERQRSERSRQYVSSFQPRPRYYA